MIVVTIRLLGGQEESSFGYIEVDQQIGFTDFTKLIENLTRIPCCYQRIQLRAEELPIVEHPLETAKFGDEISVQHSLLSMWSNVLDREITFSQSHEEELKKTIHRDAAALIDNLEQSRFFLVYPSLGTRRISIEKKFYTYFDRKVDQIRRSTRAHFTKAFGEKSKVTFGSREDGSRAGCICVVDDGSTICQFFVKTHHGAGDKSSHSQFDIDIKEMFVYTFLEALKIGAPIEFIINESHSKWKIYIASKEIPHFSTLKLLELTEPDTLPRYSKAVVEMLCVYSVLMLADHHTANMGFDKSLNPYILDFIITGRRLTGVRDLYDAVRMSKKINATLGSFEERIKISTEYLIKSKFLDVLERSIASFLERHKPAFDKTSLVFDRINKTDDLLEYVDNVRRNISLFVNNSMNQ